MMMTTMMMVKMRRMIGKNLKKKRSGILTSMNSMCLLPKLKKVPEWCRRVKKGKEEEDDFKVDDEFKEMGLYNDSYDDDEEDDY